VTHKIYVEGLDGCYEIAEGKAVLDAFVSDRDKFIQLGCRGGGCGVCKIKILSGSYRCGKMSKTYVSEEDLARGEVLACKTFAEGDLLIRPLTDRTQKLEKVIGYLAHV